MIEEYHFTFDELKIVAEDLTLLLGFEDGFIPEPFPNIIKQALLEAPRFCNIKGGYQTFESIKIDREEDTIEIENILFSPSKIVTTQLKDSTSAALFVCTAGEGISDHANQLLNDGDPLASYIFDVIGSVTVEKAMDKLQKKLELNFKKIGLSISDRYAPGYCEWSVGEQQQLFSLLPDNFCGITISDSALMSPIKSVSGIIGIGKNLQQKGFQCRWCNDKNCIYGKIKEKAKQDK